MPPTSTILIVDDDEAFCRLLASAFKREGFQVEICTTGEGALEYVRRNPVSLMLLDLRLAEMTGQEVVELMAREGNSVPFIVISGVSDVRVAVELMQGGAMDFLLKDTELLHLVAPVVRRCLERLEERRQLAEMEQRFLHLANNIQSLFWVSTPEFDKFLYLSPACEQIWGLPVQSVYDHPQSLSDAVVHTDLPNVQAGVERLRAGADASEFDFRIVRPDGEIRWLQCAASAQRNSHGRLEAIAGIVRDVTDRKEVERRLIAAVEKERRRLGQDLHDDLCQRLAALKLRCNMLERTLSKEGNPHASVAAEVGSAIADCTALSRSLARGLSPVAVDSHTLPAALEVLTASAATIFGKPVRLHCRDTVTLTDPDTATHLYRIAQELISNAAKHADPTHIDVELRQDQNGLLLQVESDGIAFVPPDGKPEGSGMGMHFLRSRADAIGAALIFSPGSNGNGGTRVQCVLPTQLQQHHENQIA